MKFEKQDLINGQRNKQKQEETAATFGELSGTSSINTDGKMQQTGGTRMAGREGYRALEIMSDPREQARTANWMRGFGLTVPGAQFNAAKMGGAPQQ